MKRRLGQLVTIVSGFACLVGCASDPTPPQIRPAAVVVRPAPAVRSTAIVARHDLREALGEVVGVTIDENGRRLVLSRTGVMDLESRQILWTGTPETNIEGWTDLASLGEGRVALTSARDGYIVDLEAGAMDPHFCYEPGWWEPEGDDPIQVSQAVAHDAADRTIYAQPRTLLGGGFGPATESFIAAYDEVTGADLEWWGFEDVSFRATGMTVLEGGQDARGAQLLLASGTRLFTFDAESGDVTPTADLAGYIEGSEISGLAIDREAGVLLVAVSFAEVIELRMDALGL